MNSGDDCEACGRAFETAQINCVCVRDAESMQLCMPCTAAKAREGFVPKAIRVYMRAEDASDPEAVSKCLRSALVAKQMKRELKHGIRTFNTTREEERRMRQQRAK